MATFAASGVVFLHYWYKTREQFFLLFGVACWMLSIERLPLLWLQPRMEQYTWCYLFRLTAFVLILFAFFRANQRKKNSRP
jgi:hypothetical protein